METAGGQTNSEAEMSERIHKAFSDKVDGGVVDASAWTHYSYGIRDALAILTCPIAEIHMSNIHAREELRHKSVWSRWFSARYPGCGVDSYLLGLRAVVSAANA